MGAKLLEVSFSGMGRARAVVEVVGRLTFDQDERVGAAEGDPSLLALLPSAVARSKYGRRAIGILYKHDF